VRCSPNKTPARPPPPSNPIERDKNKHLIFYKLVFLNKTQKIKKSFGVGFSCESSSSQRSTLGPGLEANFNFGNFFSKFKIDSQGTLEPT
jgi:hypothetical protein